MDAKITVIALCAILALTGCVSTPSGSLCPAGPIILSPDASERLTRPEKEQIVALNNAGVDICGWQQPN